MGQENPSLDLLFVFPPTNRPFYLSQSEFINGLGAGYIQAFIKKHGFTSSQYTHSKPITLYQVVDEILRLNPKVVGFTCYDSNFYPIKQISEQLKKRRPGLWILLGGPGATFDSERLMEAAPWIDACIRFDGEETTLEMMQSLKENDFKRMDCSKIKGLTYRDKNGRIIKNEDRPVNIPEGYSAENCLDYFPSPYLEGIFGKESPLNVISMARGCVGKCAFCCFTQMGRKLRFHSIDRVISELKVISQYSDRVRINDDAFNASKERAKEFCRQVIKNKIKLMFFSQLRVENTDEELLDLMKEANFVIVNFGLESASPPVLRKINRLYYAQPDDPLTLEENYLNQIKRYVTYAKKIGLTTSVSVIFGLPGETLEDGLKTIEFVKKLPLDSYAHNTLVTTPGTPIFEESEKYGLKIKKNQLSLYPPYKVEHPYDLKKIPTLPHDDHLMTNERALLGLKMALSNYDVGRQFGFKYVWLNENTELNEEVKETLNRELTFDHRIFYANEKQQQQAFQEPSLVVASTNWIRKSSQETELDFKNNLIRILPFQEYLKRKNVWQDCHSLGLEIKTKEDFEQLSAFISKAIKLGEITNKHVLSETKSIIPPKEFLKGKVFIFEACRFSHQPCPASQNNNLHMEKNLLKPCLHAQAGKNMNEMVEKNKRLQEKTEKDRGCQACEVKDNCAKCLFPHPLTPEQYCQAMKEQEVTRFVHLLEQSLIRTLTEET